MPCYDGREHEEVRRRAIEVALCLREATHVRVDACEDLIDLNTARLCAWCRLNKDKIPAMSAIFRDWWHRHETVDRQREAAQQDAERWAWAHTEGK